MTKPKVQKLTAKFSVVMTAGELAKVSRAAKAAKISRSAWARAMLVREVATA